MRNFACVNIAVLAVAFTLSQCQYNAHSKVEESNTNSRSALSNKGRNAVNPIVKTSVSGEYMKAFLVAYDAFKEEPDIPDPKRRLDNYNIELSEDSELYFVFLYAKRKPSERNLKGGESELGRDVTYTIGKKDYHIVARVFHK